MKPIIFLLLLLTPALLHAQETRVEAESFTNQSGTVTIPVKDDGNNSSAIGYWNKGDYISFNINVPKEGTYLFTFRVGTNISDAVYELKNEKDEILTRVNIPNTGSHGTFTSTTSMVPLKAGKQLISIIWSF